MALRLKPAGRRRRDGLSPRRLSSDSGGNVAMLFALVLTPIALLSFGSIDFFRANSARANLQDALDAATLAAARTPTSDPTQIQNVGMAALQAALNARSGVTLSTNAADTRFRLVNGRIVADARMSVTPWVAGFFLPNGLNVAGHSEVVRGSSHVEVAMVLDVTGSMNESSGGVAKIQRLREAATELVNTLEQSANQSGDPNSVRISMVPFSSSVNVGAANRNAQWISNSASNPLSNEIFTNSTGTPGAVGANRLTLFNQMNVAWRGCVETRAMPYDVQDTAASPSNISTLFVPYFAPDEPGGGDGLTQNDYSHGLGYLNDYLPDGVPNNSSVQYKQGNISKYNRSPTITGNSVMGAGYDYGPNFGCLTSPIVPLSSNFTALRTAIGNLTASGETNIPMGLVWGWHTISPNGPFSQNLGVPYTDPDTVKVIVLMTDGNNTNIPFDTTSNFNGSMYSGLAYIRQNRIGVNQATTAAQRTAQMDSRLSQLCTNLRNQRIVVYTVRVEVTDGDSSVLQNCASSAANYYDVQNASNLTDAFRSIAGSITRLRIAH